MAVNSYTVSGMIPPAGKGSNDQKISEALPTESALLSCCYVRLSYLRSWVGRLGSVGKR